MSAPPRLDGLAAPAMRVRSTSIHLDSLEVRADIGFHDFEIGAPQRLLISVDVWLDDCTPPPDDTPERAWNYDFLRSEVQRLALERRYNLQETLAHAIFSRVAELRGVRHIRVTTVKPDVYAEARGVGIAIASFAGEGPIDGE